MLIGKMDSHVCIECSVRFYYENGLNEIRCPVCGQHYTYKDGGWVR